MATDKLIPDYKRRAKLIQPDLIRGRAAYRTPINSEMLNLESEQLRYDLTLLRLQLDEIELDIYKNLDLITNGEPVVKVDPVDPSYVSFSGTSGNYLSTPNSTELNIGVNDLTIVVNVAPNNWLDATNPMIVSKFSSAVGNYSYRLYTQATGRLTFEWSNDGTALLNAQSIVHGFANKVFKWIAVTLDIDDGVGNKVVRFWTSTNGLTWTILGTPISTAGTTAVFAGTAQLTMGARNDGLANLFTGLINHVSIRLGMGAGGTVGGTEKFRFDANTDILNKDATTFPASTGQIITVTKTGGAPTTLVMNAYRVLSQVAGKVEEYDQRLKIIETIRGLR